MTTKISRCLRFDYQREKATASAPFTHRSWLGHLNLWLFFDTDAQPRFEALAMRSGKVESQTHVSRRA